MLKATILLCAITCTVYIIDTWALSLRIAIYKNKQYTLTGSVFNLISLIAKFAQTFQAPLLGILIDVSIRNNRNPEMDFRLILAFASIGVFLSILILPTFLNLFTLFVNRSANMGSVYRGLISGIDTEKIKKTTRYIQIPNFNMINELKQIGRHKNILLLHIIITAVYATGILSSYYAAMYLPESRLSIAGFSGSINSIASLLMLIVLEPKIAIINDEALKGRRDYSELKLVVLILIFSKLIGTLIAQMLFIPASQWVFFIYKILT